MNITIISILLPYPLDSGGAQAQFNMIDALRHRHNITLVYPENEHNSRASAGALQQMWPEVRLRPYAYLRQMRSLHFLVSKAVRAFKLAFCRNAQRFKVERVLKPYGYDLSADFRRFVNKAIKEDRPDVVQVEFYPYLHLVHYLPKDLPKVFVHHEIRYVRNERFMQQLHATARDMDYMRRLKDEEIADLNLFDKIVTLTDEDAAILRNDGVTTPIVASPAAVNAKVLPYRPWNKTMVFVGGYGHGPNVEGMEWLFGSVFPLVDWEKYPGVAFRIVGKGWSPRLLPDIKGLDVQCLGFVDDLADAAYGGIMLVPILSGSGMRMKILEGAAMSMPILTTTVGVEGIHLPAGEACLVADEPAAFARKLEALFETEDLRKTIATSANTIFRESYSVKALAERREKVYETLGRRNDD